MEFKLWLERRGEWNLNNVIVVDIQKEYVGPGAYATNFPLVRFATFLKTMLEKGKQCLYFYNGRESLGINEDAASISAWLANQIGSAGWDDEYGGELDDTYNLFLNRPQWTDKGYAFFRSWMDYGLDESIIIKTIRYMIMNRMWSSDEIENLEELLGDDYDPVLQNDPLVIPQIEVAQLRKLSGAYLCGGGESECLAEVRLLMNAFNIRYTMLREFIF